MTRDVDLVSYLPPFLAEFREITAALQAENPEFTLIWDAADRVLKNEFIETADENGIARFEKLLKIYPELTDTIELRRTRIMARWFTALPYTLRMLIKKLASVCGENNFTVETDFEHYRIKVETMFELAGEIKEVEDLLERMVPANIVIDTRNKIAAETSGVFYVGGAICETVSVIVSSDLEKNIAVSGKIHCGGCVSEHKCELIE